MKRIELECINFSMFLLHLFLELQITSETRSQVHTMKVCVFSLSREISGNKTTKEAKMFAFIRSIVSRRKKLELLLSVNKVCYKKLYKRNRPIYVIKQYVREFWKIPTVFIFTNLMREDFTNFATWLA
jgi:hypothetical protein